MIRRIEATTRVALLLALAAVAAVTALAPRCAQAQVGRQRGTYAAEPDYWVGLSYGFMDGATFADGATSTTWDFGYTSQIRATLEKTLQRGVTGGIAASFATAPLDYVSSAASPIGTGCEFGCQANADVSQYVAFIRAGGRPGFHGLFNLEAGATQFSHFRDRTSGATLPPTSAKYDFTFGFGGGFAYGMSPSSEIYVTDGWDIVLHPRGATAGASSAPRVMAVQLGGRIGF
jgi:hypothetical protein